MAEKKKEEQDAKDVKEGSVEQRSKLVPVQKWVRQRKKNVHQLELKRRQLCATQLLLTCSLLIGEATEISISMCLLIFFSNAALYVDLSKIFIYIIHIYFTDIED